ncbi:hypothetical protein, partial [Escherichia coli]
HAGKVLVTDAPQAIIDAHGAGTLEDAFIAHMLDAMPQYAAAESTPEVRVSAPAEALADRPGFSLRRLLAFTTREAMQV